MVAVSAVSALETSIKRALGKLTALAGLEEAVKANDFEALLITVEHAQRAGALPRHHYGPLDRMLIAQAQSHDLIVVTWDERFLSYGIRWLDA